MNGRISLDTNTVIRLFKNDPHVARLTYKNFFMSLFIFFLLSACAHAPVTRPEDALESISWWRAVAPRDDREFKGLADAVRQSLEYYKKLPPEAQFYLGPDRVTALDMVVTLQNLLLIIENGSLTYDQKVKQIKKEFVLYRSVGSNGSGRVLFTGYYEPVLACRLNADDVYKYPLYKRPDDIVEIDLSLFGNGFPKNKIFGRLEGKKVIPYYSREEIDQKKAFAGRDLEILWCADILDIYTLQVQGSGKVDLGDGNVISVLYDGQNGRPYRSLGKYLIDAGAIPRDKMSMQAIREYLRAHPDEIFKILNQNPSYVFFRIDMGPSVGNIGVPLTPGRSIATDSKLFPKGAIAIIHTEKPVIENNAIKEWIPFTRFVLNQDTGGAIKGPGRVDLFWGQGPEAEISAGYMQQEGELYFLVRKK
jgi:membrane-bound lytic murein transglycosylase A